MRNLIFYLAMIEDPDDRVKFEFLYGKYRNLMYQKAYQILQDQQLAEDAVHDSFIKLAKHIAKVNIADSPEAGGFVMTILTNTAIDAYRKRKREQKKLADWKEAEEVAVVPNMDQWQGSALGEAILNLAPDYRQVILWKYAYGLSNGEIAELTGFTIAKIEKLLSRGKKKLNQLLEEKKHHA